MKKTIALLLSFAMLVACFSGVNYAEAKPKKQSTTVSTTETKKREITDKQRNRYYKSAAFIGNSLGLGQKYFFSRQGKNYLGNPKMLVRGCYSFYNDKHHCEKWMIHYNGRAMMAKNAVKACGCDKVFINMGTNDFFYSGDRVFQDYKEYIKGIRKVNPDVIIFIESTVSVTSNRQGRNLNSRNIARLNQLMKEYCKEQRDMYFIDVSSKLHTKQGHLKNMYASDNYCHLTDSAYRIWTNEMIKYTDKLMLKEADAKRAVRRAEKKKTKNTVKRAKKLVAKLDKSTLKKELYKRTKAIVIKKKKKAKKKPRVTEPVTESTTQTTE